MTVLKGHVLIIDDDPDICANLRDRLIAEGYHVSTAADGVAGLTCLKRECPEVVLLDLQMPEMDGMEVLRRVKDEGIYTTIAVITAYGNIDRAVEAMKLGAHDFIEKPFKAERIRLTVERAMERERLRRENLHLKETSESTAFEMIGSSAVMRKVADVARRAAESHSTVLLTGESGTGKGVLAENIHRWSDRADRPFVAVNCVALTPSLIESELFGHERGAFTGAHRQRRGRFEAAQGGTIFLDEVGSTERDLQLRLLRVLQERQFERVGGGDSLTADVRVIAATNRDLKERIAEGGFLEDLYYRLNVVQIDVPPLRERREDISELTRFFLHRHALDSKRVIEDISDQALQCLQHYGWPGNVRELENAIERAVVLGEGDTIGLEDFPDAIALTETEAVTVSDYRHAVDGFRRSFVQRLLDEAGGNQSQAAEQMGLQRAYLSRLIKRLGLR